MAYYRYFHYEVFYSIGGTMDFEERTIPKIDFLNTIYLLYPKRPLSGKTDELDEFLQFIEDGIKKKVIEKLCDTDPNISIQFLNYHFQKYHDKEGNSNIFLIFLSEQLDNIDLPVKRKEHFVNWIETKGKEIIQSSGIDQTTGKPDRRFNNPQQMLLLERLGIIKYLDKFNLTAENKAVLISKITGKAVQNTREYLGTLADTKHKDTCNTPKNNELIDNLFTDLGIL